MTDTTIANLPAGAPAEPTDQIPIARGGANYSLTAQDIANLGGGGGGSPGGSTGAVQYNNNNSFAGNDNYTTDGNGNVTMTGAGGTNGSLTITNQGINTGQTPALTLIDNGGGTDGISEVFKVLDGATTLNEVAVNINPTNFYIEDVTNELNILNYQYPTSLSVGNASTGLFLTGLNTTLVESPGSVTLTLGNPDQQTTQNPNLYVNGQNAAIWAQGQNARLYANDGTGTNFIAAGTDGLVVGLIAYTDAKGRGTVNAESYYVNGNPIFSYGQFVSENTQTVVSVGDAQSITFTGSSGTADITLVDSSKITFANPGVYLVAASVVTNDTVGGNALVYWVNQNNTPITDSATVCGQPIGGLLLTSACTYIVTTTTAGDYIEMVMTGQATTNEITATPAGTVGAASPLSPSIIVTVNKVG